MKIHKKTIMKKVIIYLSTLTLLIFSVGWSKQTTFNFKGISEAQGVFFFIIVKNEEAFKQDEPAIENILFRTSMEIHSSDNLQLIISGLKPGKYAAKFFHDVNGNGLLDTNAIKIPKEPFGFSNNAKGMFGPPKFKDCIFEIKEGENEFSWKL